LVTRRIHADALPDDQEARYLRSVVSNNSE